MVTVLAVVVLLCGPAVLLLWALWSLQRRRADDAEGALAAARKEKDKANMRAVERDGLLAGLRDSLANSADALVRANSRADGAEAARVAAVDDAARLRAKLTEIKAEALLIFQAIGSVLPEKQCVPSR